MNMELYLSKLWARTMYIGHRYHVMHFNIYYWNINALLNLR